MATAMEKNIETLENEKLNDTLLFEKNREIHIKEKSKTKLRSIFKVNPETMPLKITLFLFFGAMSAILPYVTIHMQSIGISITEVAIIYAVLPFTSFVGPPVLGALADRIGNYKWILIIATFGNGFFHSMLLFVPLYHPPMTHTYPSLVKWSPYINEAYFMPEDTKYCDTFNSTTFKFQARNFSLFNCQQYLTNSEMQNNETNLFQSTQFTPTLITDYFMFNCAIRINNVNSTMLNYDNSLTGELLCKTNVTQMIPSVGNEQVTFWVYFLIRIVATIFAASCFSLLDATILAVVKRCGKAEYGKERMWSIIGSALVSPIAGILVDQVSKWKNFTDYSPAFYLSNVLLIFCIINFLLIELHVEKPEKGILTNGAKLLHYPEVVVFLVMIFLLGNLWGFVESFLFIFLKDLEAPNYLLGLTLTVGSLVGLPFLWGAERIVAKFGRVNLIIIAFFTYFVRFFGYSYLVNPFWCFPFEAMEALTFHLMWTAAATYCAVLAPKGMIGSLTGIMGSLHYSLGKGAGSFLGGLTYGEFGARDAFRYFGMAAGIFGIIFFLLDFFWIRTIIQKQTPGNNNEKEEVGKEMRSMSKGSLFNVNPLSQTPCLVTFDEKELEDEGVIEKMIKKNNI